MGEGSGPLPFTRRPMDQDSSPQVMLLEAVTKFCSQGISDVNGTLPQTHRAALLVPCIKIRDSLLANEQ